MPKKRAAKPSPLSLILGKRPSLDKIQDVAVIDDGCDQIWAFWIAHIGAPAIRKICEKVGAPAKFGDVHALLVKCVGRA